MKTKKLFSRKEKNLTKWFKITGIITGIIFVLLAKPAWDYFAEPLSWSHSFLGADNSGKALIIFSMVVFAVVIFTFVLMIVEVVLALLPKKSGGLR